MLGPFQECDCVYQLMHNTSTYLQLHIFKSTTHGRAVSPPPDTQTHTQPGARSP